jgi:hypothetical protein
MPNYNLTFNISEQYNLATKSVVAVGGRLAAGKSGTRLPPTTGAIPTLAMHTKNLFLSWAMQVKARYWEP